MPVITSLSTSFLNKALCNIGTGYRHEHTGFASYFISKSTGLVLHVPRILSKIYSKFLIKAIIISCYYGSRCWHCLVITLVRSEFQYFVSNNLRICRVELTVLSESKPVLSKYLDLYWAQYIYLYFNILLACFF